MSERHLGQTLGKYRIEELIGSGGFAWVYKAFDPELEIHIALKVLKPQFAGDETFEQRFRREAATAAKLRHPNIIKIYSVGRDGEAVYFAMDYYPSGLADRLEVSSSLPEEFVVRVGVDVAQALGYAHREGVIHRDIKVDNILFDAHGNAVVADFGIARAVSGYTGQTGTNMVVGTPQYFAPEQARAKQLDGRADIYSLGVTLYRAATGRLPFEGDDWYEIARQHVEDPPPPPRTVNPNLTPAFEAAILHCLQKQADDRPATGELLAQELVTLLPATLETGAYRTRITGAEPTLIVRTDTHPTGSNGTTSAKRANAMRWLAGMALIVGLVAAISVVSWWRNADSAPPPTRPDSTPVRPATTPPPITPPTSVDSVRPDSTLRPVVPPRGHLNVKAPPGANVIVRTARGRQVIATTGPWTSDTLRPGQYRIVASVQAPDACPTATDSVTTAVRPGRQQEVTVNPRSCGTLSFTANPHGAQWTLTSLTAGDAAGLRQGRVPASKVLLPAGDYLRVISRERCTSYPDTVTVGADADKTLPKRTLICQ